MNKINDYIYQQKEIQRCTLSFIDGSDGNFDFQDLKDLFEDIKIKEDKHDFRSLLHLIVKITNHHHRASEFLDKIETILSFFTKDDFERNFENDELFKICCSSKPIILYFIEHKILVINRFVKNLMYMSKNRNLYYPNYFYPELKDSNVLNKDEIDEIEKENEKLNMSDEEFKSNRKIGENHRYICKLIRNDSVEEFITYVNRTNLSLATRIEPSIFETNRFLMRNKPNLIEYAAFFGSIQIVRYLYFSRNDLLDRPLWNYVIHGRNPELVHYLEENNVKTVDNHYLSALKESVLCHHNEITDYILDNYIDEYKKDSSYFSTVFKSYNYSYFPDDLNNSFIFFHLCKNDYYKLVENFANLEYSKIEFEAISFFFLFMKFLFNI